MLAAAVVPLGLKIAVAGHIAVPSAHVAAGEVTQEVAVIILGVVLLIVGFIAKVAILWTIGIVLVVIGAILALLGMAGREIGGRRHYY